MHKLELWFRMLRMAVMGKVQYKADFFVGILSILILNAVNVSLIGVMVYNFNTLNGWTLWDLMFLYSFWMLCRGVYGVFFWHLSEFEQTIVRGEFDFYLVRPLSPLFQLLAKDINYTGVGDLLVGALGFILAKAQTGAHWDALGWAYFALCVLSGAAILVALNWIGASLCFWMTRSNPIMRIVERFVVLMQQYPVDIFGRWFQYFVTCALPVAFINYYPSVFLLGKREFGYGWLLALPPVVGLLLLVIGALVWTRGVKRYSGTGS